jgi:hypothetical protein
VHHRGVVGVVEHHADHHQVVRATRACANASQHASLSRARRKVSRAASPRSWCTKWISQSQKIPLMVCSAGDGGQRAWRGAGDDGGERGASLTRGAVDVEGAQQVSLARAVVEDAAQVAVAGRHLERAALVLRGARLRNRPPALSSTRARARAEGRQWDRAPLTSSQRRSAAW